jgi:hypothetical protein
MVQPKTKYVDMTGVKELNTDLRKWAEQQHKNPDPKRICEDGHYFPNHQVKGEPKKERVLWVVWKVGGLEGMG